MNSFFRFSAIAAVLASVLPRAVFAHPLDVSATTMTVSDNGVSATTALHPSEVERILGMRGIPMRSVTYGDYYSKKEYVFDYLKKTVSFSADGKPCEIGNFQTRDRTVDEIFAEGFPVSYSFSCSGPVGKADVEIRIFNELPLQTNRLTLLGTDGSVLAYKVLTPVISNLSYDIASGPAVNGADADADGLSDEEENAYRTDAGNPDSDGDNYFDGEEVAWGWNPLSKDLSPGQKYREEPLVSAAPLPTFSGVGQGSSPSGSARGSGNSGDSTAKYQAPVSLLDSSVYGADFFREVLRGVAKFADAPSATGFWTLFLLTAVLGFVHAAGPGHSKTLLVASVVDRRRGFWSGIAFAVVFTITHLADVAILVLLTKYVFEAFDPGPYMLAVQRFGSLGLGTLAIYLAYRAYRDWGKNAPEAEFRTMPGWKDVFAGFFAGLAPCAFGWGIFLVLFSLGKIGWALPLLGALGIGIFACLFLVLSAAYFLRERAFRFAPLAIRYSQAVSAFAISAVAAYSVFSVW